jgi:hypothetical protein
MTRQRIRRGIFRSIADLQTSMLIWPSNTNPKLFPWTKSADAILANSTASLYLLFEPVH